jgi:pimeloyl-ACP methyl ester carboxylesterase
VTPATVEAGGVELAYEERGEGRPAVFVHGTAAARTVWRETIDALHRLRDGVRAIAYDRRAYGDSGAPEPYGGTTVGEQADDLAVLVERLDAAPAIACGHELGALAVLDLGARHRSLVERVVVVEPPLLWLVADGTDAVAEMREAVARSAREDGAAGAVRAYLEEAGGAGVQELLGRERADASLANPRAFAADMAAVASWAVGRRELRQLAVPCTIVIGTRSAPVRREAARALDELLPDSRLVEAESGHFVHVERPDVVAAAVAGGGV